MTNLRCGVVNCAYNEEKLCCLDHIKVGGSMAEISESTRCDSFQEKTENMRNASETMSPNTALKVECDARKCTYNDECKCVAKGIRVQGACANECTDTMCATFKIQ